jgi:hypothetical protein
VRLQAAAETKREALLKLLDPCAWQAAGAGPGHERTIDASCGNPVTSQYSQGRLQMNAKDTVQPMEQPRTPTRARANAKISVQNSEARPYDQTTSPALVDVRITETFTGDIEGESPVRALQVLRDDKSACLVSLQRVSGKLGGRQGTFVLQGSEVVEDGKIKATWSVVPGSGTGGLSGLRGEGGFEGEFGKGSNGTLDYWFE